MLFFQCPSLRSLLFLWLCLHTAAFGKPASTSKCIIPRNVEPSVQCTHVRQQCMNNPLTDSVGIEYLDFYYCAMKPRGLQALALVVLALALSFLFCGLATASSDFFCPNLGALAEYFNLPDDVAGATLLALGNAAPDLFSSLAALSAVNTSGMALGELLGAGLFVGGFVVGMVILQARTPISRLPVHFLRVDKKVFLRDIGFLLVGVLTLGVSVVDGWAIWWEGVIMLSIYAAYVLVLIWSSRQHRKRVQTHLTERTSGSFPESVDHKTIDEEIGRFKLYNDDDDDDDDEEVDLDGLEEKPFLRRKSNDDDMNECLLAIEEEDIHQKEAPLLNCPSIEQAEIPTLSQCGICACSCVPLKEALDWLLTHSHNNRGDRLYHHLFPIIEEWPKRSWWGRIQSVLQQPIHFLLGLTVPVIVLPQSPNGKKVQQQIMMKAEQDCTLHADCWTDTYCCRCAPEVDPAEQLLPWDRVHLLSHKAWELGRKPRLIQLGLMPICLGWIFLGEIEGSMWLGAPVYAWLLVIGYTFVMLLYLLFLRPRLYLKRVLLDQTTALHSHHNHPKDVYGDSQKTVPSHDSTVVASSRNSFTDETPVTSFPSSSRVSIGSRANVPLAFKVPASALMQPILTPPWQSPFFAAIGFLMAMGWIYATAEQIVSLLVAIGEVLGVEDEALLGWTVLTFGNSMGDWVANTTMARQGFATMSITACLAGPLMNVLLTWGIGCLLAKEGRVLHLSLTVLVCYGCLLLMCLVHLVAVPLQRFHLQRWYGWTLVGGYLSCLALLLFLHFCPM